MPFSWKKFRHEQGRYKEADCPQLSQLFPSAWAATPGSKGGGQTLFQQRRFRPDPLRVYCACIHHQESLQTQSHIRTRKQCGTPENRTPVCMCTGLYPQGLGEEALADDVYDRIQNVDTAAKGTNSHYSYFTDELIEQVINALMEKLDYTESQASNLLYSSGPVYTPSPALQSHCGRS